MPPSKKTDPDKADEQAQAPVDVNAAEPAKLSVKRLRDAQFLGGRWVDAGGVPFTPAETRQIHQARDREAMEARLRALRGDA